ncbi:N-acetylmuramoyl-L-alanine amidase [Streptomyces sp. NBC_01795]|nr:MULTISPECIES: N-acetylmuramoyl-L-alanine amidase [unclassified Streptomyces]WSA97357.1 N-acetylmuramoyl-L-alanine amidase [Streptomyces sp. NBC_01795]WSB81787.1 N-acetylmuramoyl-L-alanine amidase [Streptomyces sp. NBC_01775]WSS17450.1 N-acetylmuramoyl-L-alanine amidase [Streptomyces sp. NBC_01186]WSS46197.1 N-acetylmuramoyl-L-alanine amidase [Streptomyces sp. NBC_01187]
MAASAVALVCVGAAGCSVLPGGDDGGRGTPSPSAASGKGTGDDGSGKGGKNGGGAGGGGGKDAPKSDGPALRGRTIVIDPGHNPHNRDQPGEISRLVDIGTAKKECDTTGTATNSGYAEADFTLDLARRVRTALQEHGAKVKFTHDGDDPYGPCVDERANIGNRAQADAVISLHADGAPSGSRGFHVILPASVHKGEADTRRITDPSRRLGTKVRDAFRETTGERPANYLGDGNGLDTRGDLGGLNLSTVPKVFLECGNMRDPHDADLLTSAKWRGKAAHGVADGITSFLAGKRTQKTGP